MKNCCCLVDVETSEELANMGNVASDGPNGRKTSTPRLKNFLYTNDFTPNAKPTPSLYNSASLNFNRNVPAYASNSSKINTIDYLNDGASTLNSYNRRNKKKKSNSTSFLASGSSTLNRVNSFNYHQANSINNDKHLKYLFGNNKKNL